MSVYVASMWAMSMSTYCHHKGITNTFVIYFVILMFHLQSCCWQRGQWQSPEPSLPWPLGGAAKQDFLPSVQGTKVSKALKGAFTLANFTRNFALSLHVLLNKNYLFSLLNVQASAKSRVRSRQCKCTFKWCSHKWDNSQYLLLVAIWEDRILSNEIALLLLCIRALKTHLHKKLCWHFCCARVLQ